MRARDDKLIQDASTSEFLAHMWEDQQKTGQKKGGVDDVELVDVDMEDHIDEEESEEESYT